MQLELIQASPSPPPPFPEERSLVDYFTVDGEILSRHQECFPTRDAAASFADQLDSNALLVRILPQKLVALPNLSVNLWLDVDLDDEVRSILPPTEDVAAKVVNQPRFGELFARNSTRPTIEARIDHAQNWPRSRHSDPRSSSRAATDMRRSGVSRGQALVTLELVRTYPGMTSRELGQQGGLNRYQIARRLPELRAAGLVRSVEEGSHDARWFPVD
jgi:hypothetical protein